MEKPMTTLMIGIGGSGGWTAVHVKRQLYDTYDNQMPDNVALMVMDTNRDYRFSAGGVTLKRRPGMGIGSVEIDPGEYVYVGGSVYDLSRSIAQTQGYPHMASWFMADYYLRNIPTSVFTLDTGAGQFRQFGRMALFRDVIAPAESRIYQNLRRRLTALREHSSGAISVIIVGSLTGGTGAGLFADIAYLIRKVAKQAGVQVRVRGFFYLPAAFRATLNPAEVEEAYPRSFAALRELKRFLMIQDYGYGYPMNYHEEQRSSTVDDLWRGKLQEKLYDFIYVIDGEGQQQVNRMKLERGAAPVIADAIMGYIDHHYGNALEQAQANVVAKQTVTQEASATRRAYIGAVGAYSYILPIQQIIEGWTYKLSEDLLKRLVPGKGYNEIGEITGGLSHQHNPQKRGANPDEAAVALLKTSQVLVEKQGTTTRQVKPLSLWRQAYDIAELEIRDGDRAISGLRNKPLLHWLGFLQPGSQEIDPEIGRAIAETNKTISDTIYNYDEAAPSNKRRPANPATDWQLIQTFSQRFINNQLGPLESGGGRQGGIYREALQKFIDLQLARFAEYIMLFVVQTLNGELEQAPDPVDRKSGKLGWLLAVLGHAHDLLAKAAFLMEKVRTGGKDVVQVDRGAQLERAISNAEAKMKEDAGKTAFIGKSPAVVAQEAYLAAVMSYVEHFRNDMARSAVSQTIQNLRDYLKQAVDELKTWEQLLATDHKSLYRSVYTGIRAIAGERSKADKIVNHTVIEDLAWEDERYNTYIEEKRALHTLAEAFSWTSKLEKPGYGLPRLTLGAELITRQGEAVERTPLNRDKFGDWDEQNLDILLSYTRGFFKQAVERESIIRYLSRKFKADDLGRELASSSGYLLSIPETGIGSRASSSVLLAHDSGDRDEGTYISRIVSSLTENLGGGKQDDRSDDSTVARHEMSVDPFRLTVLSAAERIPLDMITGYTEAYKKYATSNTTLRQIYHIFPAEVRSAGYEGGLGELNQAYRMFTDRVVLLLEDENRVIQFLRLLAHRLVAQHEISDSGGLKFHYRLIIPPVPREKNEWWLTEPTDKEPSLLDAMITYVIIGDDVRSRRPDSTYTYPIHNREKDIFDYLEKAIQADTNERVQDDNLALNDEPMRAWIEAFMPPVDDQGNFVLDNYTQQNRDAFFETATLVVQHDMMNELAYYMEEQLPNLRDAVGKPVSGSSAGNAYSDYVERQEFYDLFTMSVLALRKQIDVLRKAVERRYNQVTRRRNNP